jgi:hypothetical protein
MDNVLLWIFLLAGAYHLNNYLFKSPEQREEERQMKNAVLKKGGSLLFKVLRKKL